MLSPARLTELLIEVVFLLLGALVVWLALNQRIYFDRHSRPWLALSIGLVAWGLLALVRRGQSWNKWQKWNRGGSLILLGIVMLAMSRAPFNWVLTLITVAGFILMARGIFGSLLILRQR
jgi:hypothetical protein